MTVQTQTISQADTFGHPLATQAGTMASDDIRDPMGRIRRV